MNGVDLVVLALLVAGLIGGWRSGFVARILSWIGLGLGLVLAVRVLPTVLDVVDENDSLVQFLVAMVVLFGLGLGGQAVGFAVGQRLRPHDEDGGVADWDHWSGLAAGALGSVVLLWLFLPIAANGPPVLATQVAESRTVALFEERLPPPPDALEAVQTLVGPDFPQVFEALDPDLVVTPPPEATGLSDEDVTVAARSVVKVSGPACYRIQTGTGFVVEPGVIMTNAHVVAGIDEPVVERDDGTELRAEVVLFDPDLDVALLTVNALDRPALTLRASEVGATGGVFGHPLGRPLRIAPFEIAQEIRAVGRDIYDEGQVTRDVLVVGAALAQGDSGAPLVDGGGQVVGLAFAIAPDREGVAFALPTEAMTEVLDRSRLAGTSTGACT